MMVTEELMLTRISFDGDTVEIHGLEITDRELSEYLQSYSVDDQPTRLIHLIDIGLACAQRASLLQDKDFVRNELNSVLESVQKVVSAIPEDVKTKVLAELGTGEGQALQPVDRKVDEISKVLTERIEDIRKLLADDIDPSKETSKVSQAFKKLERALDPEYVNSVPKIIETAIQSVTGEDGALSKNVKSVVIEAVKPLQADMDKLSKEVLGHGAAEEALRQTIEKGQLYEEETVERLQVWSVGHGIEVHHVGFDNKPGDILLKISDSSMTGLEMDVVIETRDRQKPFGRKSINDSMESSMAERSASYGIYLSKDIAGLGKEIGDWAEGECGLGSWIATTDEHLISSIRFLILNHRISQFKAENPEVDVQALIPQLGRIRTSLKRITNINTKATSIRHGADDIQQEGELLRDEVRGSLTAIEECLRIVGTDGTD